MKALIDAIGKLLDSDKGIIVAIDGPCASGKTTLADSLAHTFDANVIHMDDFFLQPHQRTDKRLSLPGGNFDKERLMSQVLLPLYRGDKVCYRPFLCSSMSFGSEITLLPKRLNIVEGSYSCHPDLFAYYDLHIFSDVNKATQYTRLMKRNPDRIRDFLDKWIPMEDRYFDFFDIKNKCDIIYKGE